MRNAEFGIAGEVVQGVKLCPQRGVFRPLSHFATAFLPETGTLLSLRDISPMRGITFQGRSKQ